MWGDMGRYGERSEPGRVSQQARAREEDGQHRAADGADGDEGYRPRGCVRSCGTVGRYGEMWGDMGRYGEMGTELWHGAQRTHAAAQPRDRIRMAAQEHLELTVGYSRSTSRLEGRASSAGGRGECWRGAQQSEDGVRARRRGRRQRREGGGGAAPPDREEERQQRAQHHRNPRLQCARDGPVMAASVLARRPPPLAAPPALPPRVPARAQAAPTRPGSPTDGKEGVGGRERERGGR